MSSLLDALGLGGAWGAKALARAASARGGKLRVAALSDGVARALEQSGHTPLTAPISNGRIPLDDGEAEALCGSGLPEEVEAAPRILSECARVVKRGGRVFVATAAGLARRGPERHLVTALLMHAGFIEIEQKMSRGIVITSGRVR